MLGYWTLSSSEVPSNPLNSVVLCHKGTLLGHAKLDVHQGSPIPFLSDFLFLVIWFSGGLGLVRSEVGLGDLEVSSNLDDCPGCPGFS